MKKFCVAGFIMLACMLACANVYAQWSIGNITATSTVNQYKKIEFDIDVTGAFLNPYNSSNIQLDMALLTPSSSVVTLPCYYKSGDGTSSQWKARFAPREAGQYSYTIELRVNGILKATSSSHQFVSDASAYTGFLHKNNMWSFKFDNGQLFRGVGENVAWEPRASEESGYKGAYTYDYFLPKLAAGGANFFRTWMSPWNLPLEWKKVDNTTRYTNSGEYFNPGAIEEMDQLVEQCESLGLYMMLTLDYHGALSFNWNLSNYNTINGGPIAQPAAFFTNVDAKNMYKNRLRYLVARWGYSTSIGAWEFFNEIDNATYTESNGGLPQIADADVTAWHNEMSTYLKSIDPYQHLVTTSISHRAIAGMNDLPNIDFNQKHIYQDPYVGQIDQSISDGVSGYNKPYVIGEYGYRYQDDDYGPYAASWDFDFKQGMWLGLFKPTPILPLSWWWEMFDARADLTNYFLWVNEVGNDMLLAASSGGFAQQNAHASAANQRVLAVRAGTKYYAYIQNNTNADVSTNAVITTAKNGKYIVQLFDPEYEANGAYTSLGTITASSNIITIPGVSIEANRERILILTEDGIVKHDQMPYNSSAIALPGILEAEDFDKGGESVAYHDMETTNTTGQYRTSEGVDIETCNEGGYNVTNIVAGEWLEYTVDVTKTGVYNLDVRIAGNSSGNTMSFSIDGKLMSENIIVPSTGGLQTWATATIATGLIQKGERIIRVEFNGTNFNVNNFIFTLLNEAPQVSLTTPANNASFTAPAKIDIEADASDADGDVVKVEFYNGVTKIGESLTEPYSISWSPSLGTYAITAKAYDDMGLGVSSDVINIVVATSTAQFPFPDADTPHAIPGRVEAEDIDMGAEGIAYHDLTPTNIHGGYRTEIAPDIEASTDVDGDFNLGDIQAGEWVEYTIDVTGSGKYDFYFRVATQMGGQSFNIASGEKILAANIAVPNTGAWQAWKTIKVPNIVLAAGISVLRLSFNSEFFNLNYFTAEEAPEVVTGLENNTQEHSVLYPNPTCTAFTLQLQSATRSVAIVNMQGEQVYYVEPTMNTVVIDEHLPSGMYTIIIRHVAGQSEYLKGIITR